MRVIYKYPMTTAAPIAAPMRVPYGVVRAVAVQDPADVLPTVWVEHSAERMGDPDPGDPSQIEIGIVGTGRKFDLADEWTFVGTVICSNGRLVWHCWHRVVNDVRRRALDDAAAIARGSA